ncbi:hypothetical protein [Paenibacillus zanthoxyli]|uniref:hypothetical protein n=1 Tax=Paenibacillus zanthoxyli TaxID=369399 RepID=UPI0012EBB91C|nr:hypothetical protein [Paenibacillus zanthoxyli]
MNNYYALPACPEYYGVHRNYFYSQPYLNVNSSTYNLPTNELLTENSIRVESHKSGDLTVKSFSVLAGSAMENSLIEHSQAKTFQVGSIKYVTYVYPSFQKFNFDAVLNPQFYAGLGMGRCSCKKWGNWKCHSTRYDRDCVDMNAYLNRANEHCDLTCGSYTAYWYMECGKCGQPEDC